MEGVKQHIGGIHAHHKKSAMRKVYDAHDAKDQRQTHADQGVKRSGQQTVSTGLEETNQPFLYLSGFCGNQVSGPRFVGVPERTELTALTMPVQE